MDSAHELIQLTERALFDAEQALRVDPTEANRQRVLKAWSAVREARERQQAQGDQPSDALSPPFPAQ
jgi:hypothetical protein